MAHIHLNPVFTGMSCSLGDLVFYRRGGKTFVRKKAPVSNPNSPAQQEQRSAFREAVKAWQGLPEREKMLWKVRGRAKNRTGYNLFISIYMNSLKNSGVQQHHSTGSEALSLKKVQQRL